MQDIWYNYLVNEQFLLGGSNCIYKLNSDEFFDRSHSCDQNVARTFLGFLISFSLAYSTQDYSFTFYRAQSRLFVCLDFHLATLHTAFFPHVLNFLLSVQCSP